MNRILSGALALLLLVSPITALAHESGEHADMSAEPVATGPAVMLGDIEIAGAFSRATLPNAPVGAGYLVITNKGATDDRFVSASAAFAGETQLHTMTMEGDVMKMNELGDGIVIPAGGSVTFAPGGNHVMFMKLTQPLVEGTQIPVTLTFEKAGSIEVQLEVGAINADEAPCASAGHAE
jgi:periplasmic copper chaperone A